MLPSEYQHIRYFYFLGIGGIGMSALARYFRANHYEVRGYDRTLSPLTRELENEGISIVYDETMGDAPWNSQGLTKDNTLVVRTPAVPDDEPIYTYLREHNFTILKRSEVLGLVTRQKKALCVAGTHGKTTTSTILAHLLRQSHVGTNAFLGGISNNYQSNLLLDEHSDYVVVEADEYDRSFHHLTPYMSVITSIDPDHLDIYGTAEAYQESFQHYASLVQETIVIKKSYSEAIYTPSAKRSISAAVYTYAVNEPADFYADNIVVKDGSITFDFHLPATCNSPKGVQPVTCTLGVPVWVNIENSVAAMAVAWLNGVTSEELQAGVASFSGVYRRFNIHVNTPQVAYIDDYAHHPTELNASISSIRRLYPNRHIVGVFQPHLYTRTRDFADDFAQVLSQLDEVILLPIYPARELPIAGVDSQMLLDKITCPHKSLVPKTELVNRLLSIDQKPVAIITLGAGDIDRLVPDIAQALAHAN